METKTTARSVKMIYWITQVFFWLFTATGFFAIFIGLGLVFNLLHNMQLNIGLPIEMDLVETGRFSFGEITTNVELKEIIGKIEFQNAPLIVQRIYGVFMILILSIAYYLVLTFRTFITQVYKGFYFDRTNIMLLKRISYGLLGMWILTVFYGYFQYFFLVKNLEFQSIVFTAKVETYPAVLAFALLVWVLSHIFQKGVELENENQLTI
jgi:hypothetical protein